MANKRQIPFLHWTKLTDGTRRAHWKPSPRLRALGWKNQAIGTDADETAAITRAMELNRQVAEWEHGAVAPMMNRAVPRKWTFTDLVNAYRASTEWDGLKPATRREYDVRLRQLEIWAMDGALPIGQIDRTMVRDLRDVHVRAGEKHKAAAILRVLRLLMNWAIGQEALQTNPTDKVKIPTVASRGLRLDAEQLAVAEAIALDEDQPSVALALTLALWSLQRQGDLLTLTKMAWRPLENVAPADAAVLANPRGDVMGFRLQQQKTGAWVDCPIPPFLHDQIADAFTRSQFLLSDDTDRSRATPQYLLQRRVRAIFDKAGLDQYQFRDLRRSGMSMLRDLGVDGAAITTISGHAILGRRSILDTYMPPDTRAACAAMATALRTLKLRESKKDAR
ncbi:tyrosine recombinase XerC [Croceicoccus sp. YJ47]|uniref:site-specific integrase n=1 Tax=Croceicoccus sp. YJ47 TaxID=2798724 RepID=UPI001923314D|nr:hypothetical protein [Croceicoccus sp. YJ47]QQN75017.1 hypothetical protein JD971_04795 [Croceicoccus sp. YJ47]